jgi:hypothetical protein
MIVANTQAYYATARITSVKSCNVHAPGVDSKRKNGVNLLGKLGHLSAKGIIKDIKLNGLAYKNE